ncbi:TPA: transglycosylase SLT domain-containing protein [Acinetobacter baumannii]|uniref:transglycosylase SLT domain-containing protein n=1 Tax=Acinetobacter baumannii TaxID=470 RepID=UPI00003D985B|nr:transglycosylase SLT domain-containing protein [Acinetobacter baumannii]EHU1273146.1 transglycosylase SLT domain-containing protein [Acinetobacter baumannii]EHU2630583.1 transglycosylase SLT domain-containing protein [Acinetobacter baumannii]EHU2693497.1 transglycosylase SLT domain-containing protein [Acinetobacter baumannii]EHU3243716.1 transglycosylase SLT domain-containing protein [Acinetobacter baumannii]EJG25292.1 transglycosylase SLT domain protein [Acinetobacter baumannii OIFC109]
MRIPQFNSQVAEADMPNVQISGGVTPGQAVDMVGNKIDGFANLANTVANKYKEIQDENDRVRVIDAQNKLAELRLHLENNDTDGYIKKKGADVVGFDDGEGGNFVDYYSRAYQNGVGEIANKLSNSRQRTMFQQIAARDALQFKGTLQNYFVRENDVYQQSVYSSSAERFIREINENPADFTKIDESRENLKASLGKLMSLNGKSATEAENMYLKSISSAHLNNLNAFIQNGELKAAATYKKKYGDEISLADDYVINKRIHEKLEEQQIELLVNKATTGTQEYSNPALNAPPQASAAIAKELKALSPEQMKSIRYNDQRLDVYTVHAAKEKGMEWAAPLLLGIRLAGEKSDNSAVSRRGAKSVMQFMPQTWGEYSKGGKRDINNPADTIDAALEFVDWISKKYKTKDPMVIAAYYNGGGNAATAVLKGQQPPKAETQNYLKRIDKWLSDDMGPYSKQPAKTRQQAYDEIWNSNVPVETKQKALSLTERYFNGQDKVKKDRQDQEYSNLYNGIISGKFAFEQIPAGSITALEPSQINSLKSVSKATYNKDIKTDPITLSMITLNQEELFKGKPQSVLHQFADKLSPKDYEEVTKMYANVNALKGSKNEKKTFILDNNTVALAVKPYLNIIGITSTTDKRQLEHYNAVKTDLMQTLKEAEAKNGGNLTWEQVNRVVLKNINNQVKVTTSRPFFDDKVEYNRVYSQVKSKGDITDSMKTKIDNIFRKQGRNPNNVTDAEYINAYYSIMRRGY